MNSKKMGIAVLGVLLCLGWVLAFSAGAADYPVVDTGQKYCYDNADEIAFPAVGQVFHGQDAQYVGPLPEFQDNGDGTITDLRTGLMWQQDPGDKMTFDDAVAGAATCNLAGYNDWRLPSIKELYSLIDFSGITGTTAATSIPYIDTDYFIFEYGNETAGERFIDSQYCSSTEYVGTTMMGDDTVFGVNFADGRIKGYGKVAPGPGGADKTFFVQYVRGNALYGINSFVNNGDGTVTDQATGLTWMQVDSGAFNAGPYSDGTLNWEQALDWAEDLSFAGHDDWRLPSAKELQSLVDYTQAPGVTGTAAIDVNFFHVTETEHYCWSSTTHNDGPTNIQGTFAVYVAFGRAMGWMEIPPGSGSYQLLDVHGAGSQRSDPKEGDPSDPQWVYGNGPQGDVVRIYNYVRCVRGGVGTSLAADAYTASASAGLNIPFDLDGGAGNANQTYLLLGSFAGTSPGIPLPGGLAVLPLNWDNLTNWVINNLGGPKCQGFLGTLDGSGQAGAVLNSLGAIDSKFIGRTFYFAYLLDDPFAFTSNAIAVEIEP